jgi:predicted alpha/beta hydrolase family esterase
MPLPAATIEYTKAGAVADQAQLDEALAMLDREQATDVLVISHGWNNDMPAARRLYTRINEALSALLPASTSARPVIIGILWPSVRWADEEDIAGGGVSVSDPDAALSDAIDAAVDDEALAAALREVAGRLDSVDGRAEFVELARALLDQPGALTDDEDGVPSALRSSDPDEVFAAVRDASVGSQGAVETAPQEQDAAPGVAPDLLATGGTTAGAGLFGQSWSSLARQVLNTFTYYTMKARAGDVGSNGVAALVDDINARPNAPRVHLAGHSFGARVVSAAATAASTPIASVTLLQGAFSHYGFTPNYADTGKDGVFRGAITSGRIQGPLVITHTHNDRAVHLAYAVASRLARQTGAGLGDRSDLYGGIGANGSVGTQATELPMLDEDGSYTFGDGSIVNLLADEYVSGHSDVTNRAVVNALAHAMRLR